MHKKITNLIVIDSCAGDTNGHCNLYIRIQGPPGVHHGFCCGVVDDVDGHCGGGIDIEGYGSFGGTSETERGAGLEIKLSLLFSSLWSQIHKPGIKIQS